MGNFLLRWIMFGIALSMDATAVSMANGLKYPKLAKRNIFSMSFLFGLFQGLMPLIGYFIGHQFLMYIEKCLPWIALILLEAFGINMLFEGIYKKRDTLKRITLFSMLLQAISTSIDALSVGLTMAAYSLTEALLCAGIIFSITMCFSFIGSIIGKKFGKKFGQYALILGGLILMGIGLEIFFKGM